MESQEQGNTARIEMERLNGELCPAPVPSHSSLCLKRCIILVSVVGLMAVICTSLLFVFVFRPVCDQMDMATTPPTAGKVNFTCRLKEFKELLDVFRAEKLGTYLIHGWLERSMSNSEDVRLESRCDHQTRTLPKYSAGNIVYFNDSVLLGESCVVRLYASQYTDGYFYVYEV